MVRRFDWQLAIWLLLIGMSRSSANAMAVGPLAISRAENDQQFPVAVVKRDGSAFVIWHDLRNGNRDVYGQRFGPDAKPLWETDGRPLVALDKTQGWPGAADDGADGFLLIWADSRNDEQDLYYQHFDADGRPLWEPAEGLPLAVHSAGKDDHKIIADGDGGFYAAWEDWRNGNQDIYGQHVDRNGRILWAENGAPIVDAKGDQYDPFISLDGTGGLVVTWWDVATPQWRTFAQRVSPDGQRVWGPSGQQASLSPGHQSGPFIIGDAVGGAFVFWADFRHDGGFFSNLDLYGQRFAPDGRRLWGDEALAISAASGVQQKPAGVPDGAGGVYVTWLDSRDVYEDIYVQHIDADGTPEWMTDGLPVCVADGRQDAPQLALDGENLWITWYDYRREVADDDAQDIYVQRLGPGGSPTFPAEGLPILTAPGSRQGLSIQARNGHVAVTWMEVENQQNDIFGWFWSAESE